VFSAEPGPATTANLIPIEGEDLRLVVGRGQVLDTPELPAVEMPYFHFRPDAGLRPFIDDWLRLGGTHHFVVTLGDGVGRWRRVAELLNIDYHEI
jgi:L-arabinose isomerase